MRTSRQRNEKGFTLIELMIVTAILGILASIAVVSYTQQQKKAHRTEVVMGLASIKDAQYQHFVVFGVYAGNFDDLLFATNEGHRVSSTVYQGGTYQYTISQPWGPKSYSVTATGNIDADPFVDVWVQETGRYN